MAKTHTIKKLNADFLINEGKDTWIFTKTASRATMGTVLTELDTVGTKVFISGQFSAAVDGIYSQGANFKLTLESSSRIEAGATAVGVYGINAQVVAKGRIFGGDYYGVYADDDFFSLINSGKIITNPHGYSVYAIGDDVDIVNAKGGRIEGGTAVYMKTSAYDFARLENHGMIKADPNSYAVGGGDGDERIINRGTIDGIIGLANGNNYIDTRGGKLTVDNIVAGNGNDTLITDNADYYLYERAGGGDDTIKSTVSYVMFAAGNVENLILLGEKNINLTGAVTAENLFGNAGNNKIHGMGGQDRIEGRGGNDRLWGDDGADSFVFSKGSGKDRVMDFTHAADAIVLDGWNKIRSYDDVLEHASFKGGDMTITAGKDQIILVGIDRDGIGSGDFLFA
ncbi:calcium-binding protein [Rhizobium sp.]